MGGDINETQFVALKALIEAISATSSEYILSSLKLLLENSVITSKIKEGIMPYVYAAGLLSFSAKEINSENLSALVKLIGVKPNNDLIDTLLSTGIKTHLVYVYSFYFLVASNKGTSVNDIMNVVGALGVEPDEEVAESMRDLCLNVLEK